MWDWKINEDGTIYLEKCKINNREVEYTYEKKINLCTLVEGTYKTIGAKYTCKLDEERTFFCIRKQGIFKWCNLSNG